MRNSAGITSLSPSLVHTFASLFEGRADAWGILSGGCIKETITAEHYRRHLAGKVSVGIYPLRQDSRCQWFAIDIDHDDYVKATTVIERLSTIGRSAEVIMREATKAFWAVDSWETLTFQKWSAEHCALHFLVGQQSKTANLGPSLFREFGPGSSGLPRFSQFTRSHVA